MPQSEALSPHKTVPRAHHWTLRPWFENSGTNNWYLGYSSLISRAPAKGHDMAWGKVVQWSTLPHIYISVFRGAKQAQGCPCTRTHAFRIISRPTPLYRWNFLINFIWDSLLWMFSIQFRMDCSLISHSLAVQMAKTSCIESKKKNMTRREMEAPMGRNSAWVESNVWAWPTLPLGELDSDMGD